MNINTKHIDCFESSLSPSLDMSWNGYVYFILMLHFFSCDLTLGE